MEAASAHHNGRPGAARMLLAGDPAKHTIFAARFRFPDGVRLGTHWHAPLFCKGQWSLASATMSIPLRSRNMARGQILTPDWPFPKTRFWFAPLQLRPKFAWSLTKLPGVLRV